ncbi:MAG TPA: M1 family aminopeptidase [Bryobacteraceae bacterium]|jgi:aminopeptidase N|nr:M1 family aminopeptidase [Bryobacteraceae bacterium]
MRILTALLGLALAGPAAAAPLPRPYQVEHYDVHLTPDLAAKRMAGEVSIGLVGRSDRLDAVELDVGDMQIASVKDGPNGLYFERKDKTLIVALRSPLFKSDRRTITVRYTAVPAKGLVFFPDQIYTSFFTSDWMPCDEHPEDRATLSLTLDVPPQFKVAASGHPAGKTWTLDTPYPAFLFAFAAGDFAESSRKVDGLTLRVLGKADVFDDTAAVMKFLVERSGKPYPLDTYTQVFTHGTVEQEAVGMTLFPEKYAADMKEHPGDLSLLAHEFAHQWYGVQIVARDWSDFWLSEGMATFLADSFLEQRFGKARYEKEIAQSQQTYENLRAQGRDRPLFFTDWQTPQQAGGPLPYQKGAFVLSELRRTMGDEAFWRGLRSYTNGHWGSAVTSDDFEAAMSSAGGKDMNKQLTKLFHQYIY